MRITRYETWIPQGHFEQARFEFVDLHTEKNSLVIRLVQRDGMRKVCELKFNALPLLMNLTNESFRLRSLEELPPAPRGSFFVAKDSELLRQFNRDSMDIYREDPLTHFVVLTDEWIDLIVSEQPILRYISDQ